MARSMTAFARTGVTSKGDTWSVEIRSLNHRFFEFSLKIPTAFSELEAKVKDCVHKEIRRGKVSVNISQSQSDENSTELLLDEQMIETYLKAAKKLNKKYKIPADLSVKDILCLPKVMTARKETADAAAVWPKIEKLLKQALKDISKAKALEGKELVTDIEKRLDDITAALLRIKQIASESSKRYLTKLQERIAQVLEGREIDDDRLLREAALLAEKTDITEEIVRLESHLKLFSSKLSGLIEVGRELDFLCQEINREINTIGSKAQYFDISQDVILMKKELEKIREQVQNIE